MTSPKAGTALTHHRVRRHCRACDQERLEQFLDLGRQPLANSFLASPSAIAAEPKFPLVVYLCTECGLVQLADVIDPEVLFRDYIYVTGTSTTIAEHNQRYAATVVEFLDITPNQLVVEVASNDGSLLERFAGLGVRTLGVEPARNIAALARAKGIETIEEFFSEATGRDVLKRYGPARAVIGNNVLAHVDDTQDFLRGAAALISPDGLVITEVPYLGEFVSRLEYDTVYHEHLCYFSVTSLMRLAEKVGLSVVRVDHVPVHGGSIRMYAAPRATAPVHAASVQALAAEEKAQGLTSMPRYRTFAHDVAAQRTALVTLLGQLKATGKRVVGYGAPAKGNTLLNYCGITTDLVEYTVDRNPLKVGKLAPGSHLPVRPYETLATDAPDYILILAWNFAEEIMAQPQERMFQQRGGKFILPLPTPRIV